MPSAVIHERITILERKRNDVMTFMMHYSQMCMYMLAIGEAKNKYELSVCPQTLRRVNHKFEMPGCPYALSI